MNLQIDRALARVCTARQVTAFDRDDAVRRLFAEDGTHGDYRCAQQLSRPSAESRFDVCTDGVSLFVSVILFDNGMELLRRLPWPLEEGVGPNSVEVVVCPHGDGIGFIQFGVGPGTDTWFTHHWPYRDGRPNLAVRPEWEAATVCERTGEDIYWIAFLRFSLFGIVAEGYSGPIGFNVMRTQLRLEESAAWSHTGGSGFPDATSCGWLRLSEETPAPPQMAPIHVESRPAPQLQGTYDFPDEMVGGIYTPEVLRRELRILRDSGFGRIYWIDYPHWYEESRKLLADPEAKPAAFGDWRRFAENLERTVQACGGDPMPLCARLAHEEGLEFFTVMKPFDAGNPNFPELGLRRNPAWMPSRSENGLTTIKLFADNDLPLGFPVAELRLFSSRDNLSYAPCSFSEIREMVVTRPRTRWTPAGKQAMGGEESVRTIELHGIGDAGPYFAVAFPKSTVAAQDFGNQLYLLAESDASPLTLSVRTNDADFRNSGFFFFGHGGWSDYTEGVQMRQAMGSGAVLGICAGLISVHPQLPEPAHSQVRDFWLRQWVQRAIDCGADGVDVRIAHHSACDEYLAYAFAEPVLEEFRRQTGRDPEPRNDDYILVRRIRGGFHTQFLRDAKRMLAGAGKRLEAHIEGRMKTGPEFDTYMQIHWDYATWIDEGIVDGLNLKYLGPFNPFVRQQILPRARKAGIPVHMISAIGDPRTKPRTPEWHTEMLSMVHAGGLDGLNLYELWTYMRTTPRGEPIFRGCARSVFAELKEWRERID